MLMTSCGAMATRNVIERYQPLLGLHGHIHESRAAQKIGRTLCVNPGSEYSEGVLRGAIVELKKQKIKSWQFTVG
jgi:Icc-related predicted phosphoesterase